MNKVVRISSVIQNHQGLFNLHPSFFHSSPVLQVKRRNNSDSNCRNSYNKRVRKKNGKNQFLSDASVFADVVFKSWKYHDENYRSPYSKTQQWFTQEFVSDRNMGGRSSRSRSNPCSGRRFDFCEDDEYDVEDFEVEDSYRAPFVQNVHINWSPSDEEPEREYTSRYNTRSERYRRYEFDDGYDSSEESNCSAADLTSYRRDLGLKSTGPLCLEDVKNAYRACALKWHPDRHQGSSKVVAEEKFKICSAAYESLCDQMVS